MRFKAVNLIDLISTCSLAIPDAIMNVSPQRNENRIPGCILCFSPMLKYIKTIFIVSECYSN